MSFLHPGDPGENRDDAAEISNLQMLSCVSYLEEVARGADCRSCFGEPARLFPVFTVRGFVIWRHADADRVLRRGHIAGSDRLAKLQRTIDEPVAGIAPTNSLAQTVGAASVGSLMWNVKMRTETAQAS